MKKAFPTISLTLLLSSSLTVYAQTNQDSTVQKAIQYFNDYGPGTMLVYSAIISFFAICTFIGTRKIIAARKAKAAKNKDE